MQSVILGYQCMGTPCSEQELKNPSDWTGYEWSQINCSVELNEKCLPLILLQHAKPAWRRDMLNSPLVSSNLALEMFAYL